jgi:hypothetical protein
MFDIPDYLTLRLGEEAAEVAQRVGKSLAYGHKEVNVKEPTGPNNTDKLVGELNGLLAVADMLVETGVLPENWQDKEAQAEKKRKVVTFMAHSYNQDRIEPGEEEALEELCRRYLGADISGACDLIASEVELRKRSGTAPTAPQTLPNLGKHLMRSPATVKQVFNPPLRPVKPTTSSGVPPKPSQAQLMTIYLGRIVGVRWPSHWDYEQFKGRVEAELPPDQDSREHLKECARRLMEEEEEGV